MSRISNELAGQIAYKLTEKTRQNVEKLHLEYRTLVTEHYEDMTPPEVKSCFKKHPDWFYTGQKIRINGGGFNWEFVSAIKTVICNSSSEALIEPSQKNGSKLLSAKHKWEKAKDKYATLKDETKQALLALKTFNNIRKELPEAAPMLPPPLSNALVVDFSSLKRKLNNQPEAKKETATA